MKKKVLIFLMATMFTISIGMTGCSKDEAAKSEGTTNKNEVESLAENAEGGGSPISSGANAVENFASSLFGKKSEKTENPFEKMEISEIEKMAEEGDMDARIEIADMYFFNYKVEGRDYKKAFDNYKIAADQGGDAYAQYSVGYCYETALGCEENYEEAMKYYMLSAEQNYPEGLFSVGYLNEAGLGVEKSIEAAIPWYQKASEVGSAQAQSFLADFYYYGEGIEQSYEQAYQYYKMAADQGDAYSQYCVAYMLENGQGIKADYNKAIKMYQQAADGGNAAAQTYIGYLYDTGEGGKKRDFTEAFKWYMLAADQGDQVAMFNLGGLYEYGDGVEKNMDKAKEWYQKSADAGYQPAIDVLNSLK